MSLQNNTSILTRRKVWVRFKRHVNFSEKNRTTHQCIYTSLFYRHVRRTQAPAKQSSTPSWRAGCTRRPCVHKSYLICEVMNLGRNKKKPSFPTTRMNANVHPTIGSQPYMTIVVTSDGTLARTILHPYDTRLQLTNVSQVQDLGQRRPS